MAVLAGTPRVAGQPWQGFFCPCALLALLHSRQRQCFGAQAQVMQGCTTQSCTWSVMTGRQPSHQALRCQLSNITPASAGPARHPAAFPRPLPSCTAGRATCFFRGNTMFTGPRVPSSSHETAQRKYVLNLIHVMLQLANKWNQKAPTQSDQLL